MSLTCLIYTTFLWLFYIFLHADYKGRSQHKNLENCWIYPSRLAGWGLQGAKIQPKNKDDQNGLIHPEN